MTYICENCKYKTQTYAFDYFFQPIAMFCRKKKTWIHEFKDLNGCDNYESNLHDHNAAP